MRLILVVFLFGVFFQEVSFAQDQNCVVLPTLSSRIEPAPAPTESQTAVNFRVLRRCIGDVAGRPPGGHFLYSFSSPSSDEEVMKIIGSMFSIAGSAGNPFPELTQDHGDKTLVLLSGLPLMHSADINHVVGVVMDGDNIRIQVRYEVRGGFATSFYGLTLVELDIEPWKPRSLNIVVDVLNRF
jgi:hypothetical protein